MESGPIGWHIHGVVALAFALSFVSTGAAEQLPPLTLERSIPLPGVTGRIDHMDIDAR